MGKRTKRDRGGSTIPEDANANGFESIPPSEEFELKLEVDPANLAALLGASPLGSDEAVDREQDSVYFDTPEQFLRKAGFSLRVRTVGDNRIQTMKAESAAAAGLFVRPEWERVIDGAEPTLDDDASPLRSLIPHAELDRLEPVFQVKVVRTVALVSREDAIIEVVLDRGQILAGDRSDRVHEIELELKGGAPAALFSLARELDQSAPMRLGVLTKSQRGYRLASTAPDKPVKTSPLELQVGMSTAAGFQAIVGACMRQFRLNEAILVRTGSAGALHQARVALRRLRSALSTFKGVVRDERYDNIRAELRWIAAELGQARNLDVLLERVSGKEAAKPLRAARKKAYAAVQTALASDRLRALMLDVSEWTAMGPWSSNAAHTKARAQPIEQFAADALEKHRRRLKRLGRKLDKVGDEERHEARIEAKKLRYATEFFASLFQGKKATRRHRGFHDALEKLQAHLGDLNDLATATAVLAELNLIGTPTADALRPDLTLHGPLLEHSVYAYAELMDSKRFWRG
ncbi:CHAD domain-containing protein [Sphingomonas endolithica]|uniref:CYTH and CHAD domain-containing protein n=1 Tax=Sphingomonas endolithica TaxID=2972485 RepID=UPI0021B087B1|nr:CHAD domain-containing protein [Sphingomonas sp. ZFBP2030]